MKPCFETPQISLYQGDCLAVMRSLPAESINCVVTSPPYFGLRDYGHPDQIGLEATVAEYISKLVEVFEEVRRVLRSDGVCWLNLGDSYQNKSLCLVPQKVAIALHDAGWFVRSEIIWHKQAPMPESVRDRPTKAHEPIWMLTKSDRYWFDIEAVKEKSTSQIMPGAYSHRGKEAYQKASGVNANSQLFSRKNDGFRNMRDVWTLPPSPNPEAHFATFVPEIPRRCILASCPQNGTVLDPFIGSGTTAFVAKELGRKAIGIDLNPDYLALAADRCSQLTIFTPQEATA